MTLFSIMQTSISNPDLDSALAPIQDALGVESGDAASQFFSWVEGYEDPDQGQVNDTIWPSLSPYHRYVALRRYIDFELMQVDPRNI